MRPRLTVFIPLCGILTYNELDGGIPQRLVARLLLALLPSLRRLASSVLELVPEPLESHRRRRNRSLARRMHRLVSIRETLRLTSLMSIYCCGGGAGARVIPYRESCGAVVGAGVWRGARCDVGMSGVSTMATSSSHLASRRRGR